MQRRSTYRCDACHGSFPITETPERSWGLWVDPCECPHCAAPVQVPDPISVSDAHRLIRFVVGIDPPTGLYPSAVDFLALRAETPGGIERCTQVALDLDLLAWRKQAERGARTRAIQGPDALLEGFEGLLAEKASGRLDGQLRAAMAEALRRVHDQREPYRLAWASHKDLTPVERHIVVALIRLKGPPSDPSASGAEREAAVMKPLLDPSEVVQKALAALIARGVVRKIPLQPGAGATDPGLELV